MSKIFNVPHILSGAVGAALIMVLSFSMGWVVTDGLAKTNAKNVSHQAVKDQLVPICVHQFNQQADTANKLTALRGMAEYQREQFVGKQGWATMPGSNTPATGVARECAAKLFETPA
ncbi:MAG: hypothetical protein HOM25_05450 [Rhodospirillaceae bacterium]|mgnify:FL=1|jgi:hypothetical protein|nr:hypothetical protein [Rhodospirillaceae bacterium]MBT5665681.1 hypothetical protein [Rhodospirillaceae bacterium]MBT5811724.1 hypothetical protein [Rhodospirillaceae bacterium]